MSQPQYVAQVVVSTNPQQEETLGAVIGWISNSQKADVVRTIIDKHGLADYDPNSWYPTQTVLNILRDLYKEPDSFDIFTAIGKKFAAEFPFNFSVRTFHDALLDFNSAYRLVHRGMHDEEGILIQNIDSSTLSVTNNTPWPGEILFGLLYFLHNRFESNGAFDVKFIDPDEHLRAMMEVRLK